MKLEDKLAQIEKQIEQIKSITHWPLYSIVTSDWKESQQSEIRNAWNG